MNPSLVAGRGIGGAVPPVPGGVRLGAERPEGRHAATPGRAEEGDRTLATTRHEYLVEAG